MPTLLVLGAYGTLGRLIADEAGRRNLQLILAGRQADRLAALVRTFPAGQARPAVVDVSDAATLEPVFAGADVVLNTIGPFSALADPVVDACLQARRHYVDMANELAAARALLDRDAEARRRGIALVTGAGFGVVAVETLARMLARATEQPLQSLTVAGVPAVASASAGVQATIAAGLAQGSPRYVDGHLVVGQFGDAATVLQFPGGYQRRVVAAPLGDLIAAQRAAGAPNVVAYTPVPEEHSLAAPASQELRSVAMAVGCTTEGRCLRAELSFGEGFEASAAIAVEVAVRLASAPRSGAWTPGQLFGTELAATCGAVVQPVQA
jgi:saccharopine dehydrogenase (NAD+, L-lysine-forming)